MLCCTLQVWLATTVTSPAPAVASKTAAATPAAAAAAARRRWTPAAVHSSAALLDSEGMIAGSLAVKGFTTMAGALALGGCEFMFAFDLVGFVCAMADSMNVDLQILEGDHNEAVRWTYEPCGCSACIRSTAHCEDESSGMIGHHMIKS
jgi:hypothetical protein